MKKIIIYIDTKIFSSFFMNLYRSISINKTITKLNKENENTSLYYYNKDKKNPISELCVKYGSDKGYKDFFSVTPYTWKPRNYAEFYFKLFDHCKDQVKLIFECGIGSNNVNIESNMTSGGKPGASLNVWKDYFINAEVYGADIDKDILFNSDRIKTFEVDQTNEESIHKMWREINKKDFDIMIDDGLHNYEAGITLFKNSYDKLRKNGIYIIEDVSNKYLFKLIESLKSYNPEVAILRSNLNNRNDNNLICIRKD